MALYGSNGIQNILGYLKTYLTQKFALKVDAVSGKGLSTEDFTTAEKTKLAGIETGAQTNVKPDWNAASGATAEILNKPAIPGVTWYSSAVSAGGSLTLSLSNLKSLNVIVFHTYPYTGVAESISIVLPGLSSITDKIFNAYFNDGTLAGYVKITGLYPNITVLVKCESSADAEIYGFGVE